MRLRQLLGLAWRESRFARRRLLLFLSAITLGVASLVAVQGFAANLARGVQAEARALLGADLVLSSHEPFGPAAEALLDSLRSEGADVAHRTSFASMALHPRTGATRLVQVRAPEPGYPFYGTIETEPADAWDALHDGRHAIVEPALLRAMGARRGDSLSIGEARFRIIGEIRRVPGDAEIASAFAPRVFLPAGHLEETGLLQFGSRIDHDAYLRLSEPAAAERVAASYREALRAERVRFETAADEQEGLEEAFGRVSSYLGLVAVLALLLGGIGVASAMRAYMAQKSDTVALFRCLGATARQVFAIYVVQAGVMGLAGAVIGVVLGSAVQWVLPGLFTGLLPVEVEVRPEPWPIVTGLFVGVWTAVIFAALPLLRIRRVSPMGALRRNVDPLPAARLDLPRWAAWLALLASVGLLVGLQVRDLRAALAILGGIAAALALLWLVAAGLVRAVRRLPRAGLAYVVRQGVSNLYRPANQTRTVIVALGFGVFLLATMLLTQHNLLLPLRTGDPAERANLLLWDVQDDQMPGVAAALREQDAPVLQRAPIVPMRVAAINGAEIVPRTESDIDDPPEGWAVRREYRSTFRDTLVASERLVAGRFRDPRLPSAMQVSLERDIADDLRVTLGDTIVWDVQGVRVPTVVTSLRRVDWARFEPNFFAVFPTEALEGAPRTWVVLSRAEGGEARARAQEEVVRRYSNVSAIDLTLVQEALDQVIGRISAVIRFIGAFSVATGFVVLLGAVATGRLQRLRESVLLKTLGATRGQIGWILFTEYLALGTLAVVAGLGLAAAAGWALTRWMFEVPFELDPVPMGVLGLAVAALAVGTGVWASREVFRQTPLEALREEA